MDEESHKRARRRYVIPLAGLVALTTVVAGLQAAPGDGGSVSVAELEAQVIGLDAQARAAADAQAAAQERHEAAMEAVAQNTAGLKEARRNREATLAALEHRLVRMYVAQRPTAAEVILTTGSIAAAIDQVRLVNRVSQRDAALFRQVLQTRERLAQSRSEVIAQRRVAAREAEEARRRTASVNALLSERRAVLESARQTLANSQAGAAAQRAASAPTPRPDAQTSGPDTPPPPAPPASVAAHLAKIAQCESGGNPAAISPSGLYRGKYQFHRATWESVGGSGDPAAASEAEQDHRAALLYAREGPAPWPICGS